MQRPFWVNVPKITTTANKFPPPPTNYQNHGFNDMTSTDSMFMILLLHTASVHYDIYLIMNIHNWHNCTFNNMALYIYGINFYSWLMPLMVIYTGIHSCSRAFVSSVWLCLLCRLNTECPPPPPPKKKKKKKYRLPASITFKIVNLPEYVLGIKI